MSAVYLFKMAPIFSVLLIISPTVSNLRCCGRLKQIRNCVSFLHDNVQKGVFLFFIFFVDYRPDEAAFVKLDSSLKKNTAFVRKLVSIALHFYLLCYQ